MDKEYWLIGAAAAIGAAYLALNQGSAPSNNAAANSGTQAQSSYADSLSGSALTSFLQSSQSADSTQAPTVAISTNTQSSAASGSQVTANNLDAFTIASNGGSYSNQGLTNVINETLSSNPQLSVISSVPFLSNAQQIVNAAINAAPNEIVGVTNFGSSEAMAVVSSGTPAYILGTVGVTKGGDLGAGSYNGYNIQTY